MRTPGARLFLRRLRSRAVHFGLSERKAIECGHAVKVGRFPFAANGTAIVLGDEEGTVKTIFKANTGELLGVHMIGPDATELIQGFGIARSVEATMPELMHAVFPHQTLSEPMHEAVLSAYGHVQRI
jgi:dihydrolipoamide dehydrogenase